MEEKSYRYILGKSQGVIEMKTLDFPLFMCRCTDHDTSKQAAEKIVKSGCADSQREQCYNLLKLNNGKTCKELAEIAGREVETKHLTQFVLCRRLPEIKYTMVYTKGTRNGERIWWII